MQSEHPLIVLVGTDSDLLFLRSAVLASAGIWSMRLQTADQAVDVLERVPCDMAIICYTLDEKSQEHLLDFVFHTHSKVRLLWLVPGDDCSGTGFLLKVEEALEGPTPVAAWDREFSLAPRPEEAAFAAHSLLQ